jgi:hypothetical protein
MEVNKVRIAIINLKKNSGHLASSIARASPCKEMGLLYNKLAEVADYN